MNLADLLFSQGFGTRRDCAGLIAAGEVSIGGQVIDDPLHEVDPQGLRFSVQGVEWPYAETALVLLHKPADFECSQKPSGWPSVLTLLPAPLRQRGLQPIGRLDADTTGALLLTDDGALIHRLTHPKHHVAKVYEVQLVHPATPEIAKKLVDGVRLHDERERPAGAPVRPRGEAPLVHAAACEVTGPQSLRLVLTEGKYHQVKRMVAAAGNRVAALHRSRFGTLSLTDELPVRNWRWVSEAERSALEARPKPEAHAAPARLAKPVKPVKPATPARPVKPG